MDKKSVILDILQRSEHGLSLNELYVDLNGSISTRTLRRYLDNLLKEQKIQSLGGNKNRRYLYIAAESTGVDIIDTIFSKESLAIIAKLQIPLYQRDPCTYNLEWLDHYIPNRTTYFTQAQKKILYEYGQQTLDAEPAGTFAHKIYERLLIDLSYNSSRLEGNTYSLVDTKRLLLEGTPADDKLDSEKIMILNHKDALRFLIENINSIAVTEESIRTMHYLLADGLVTPNYAGGIREEPVKVSGSVYIPLDNPKLIAEMLQKIAITACKIIDPFEQSIFLLIHLSYLQAFIDVNKRTARLACNVPLLQHNLIPISFAGIGVNDYRTAIIAIYEFNQVAPLLDLYIWSYIRSSKEYSVTIESLGLDVLRVKYRTQRRKLLQDIIKNNVHTKLKEYIKQYAQQNIPAENRAKFIADVETDMNAIDSVKMQGLGVSKQEFIEWHRNISTSI